MALSVMLTEAVRPPVVVGVNVTVIVQLPPAATEPPHVFVSPKSPALVPVSWMLVMVKAAFPVLFRVTTWEALGVRRVWLPKFKVVAVRLTKEVVPVPVRATVCGLGVPLLVSVKEAVRVPLAEGVKVTLIVQVAPAATDPPQVSLSLKSVEFAPVMRMGGV